MAALKHLKCSRDLSPSCLYYKHGRIRDHRPILSVAVHLLHRHTRARKHARTDTSWRLFALLFIVRFHVSPELPPPPLRSVPPQQYRS